MQLLLSILGILITILFVIGTHEAAHFGAARLLGVKVLRFSIGFGKALRTWRDREGTEFVLAWIPLGGYVKMLDENEGTVPEHEKQFAFNRQPFYKKFLIVLAGPCANIVCAFLLYWIIFMVGFVTIRPIIGDVTPSSIAAKAGLVAKQEIVSVDNYPISSWMNIIFRLVVHTGTADKVVFVTKIPGQESTQSHLVNLTTWKLDSLNPDPLDSLGLKPYAPEIPLVIGLIKPNSPAEQYFKIGDKIIALNNKPIANWDELILFIASHPDEAISLKIERAGKTMTIPLVIGSARNIFLTKSGYLGIAPKIVIPPELLRKIQFPPIEALQRAGQEIYDFTYLNLFLFAKILTGKISLQSLGGPITIFESAGSALNFGLIAFLGFLAFLSISIGIINLLPIPGLDGGHLFFQIIEAVLKRPIPEKLLATLYYIGFFFLFFILIQAISNDILRLH